MACNTSSETGTLQTSIISEVYHEESRLYISVGQCSTRTIFCTPLNSIGFPAYTVNTISLDTAATRWSQADRAVYESTYCESSVVLFQTWDNRNDKDNYVIHKNRKNALWINTLAVIEKYLEFRVQQYSNFVVYRQSSMFTGVTKCMPWDATLIRRLTSFE